MLTLHPGVLAARRRDPQPQGVRDAQRAVQAGGALAQQVQNITGNNI